MRDGRLWRLSVRFHDIDMFVLYCGLPSVTCFYFRALLATFSGLKRSLSPVSRAFQSRRTPQCWLHERAEGRGTSVGRR